RPIKKPTFWDLNLPRETQGYVPRILALSRFIEQADKYNFQLPNIPNRPLTESVSTGNRQIDLSLAAELAELPLEKIYELNAGLNQWATPPDGPHRLLLPISHAERFRNNLELAPAPLIEWRRHKVKSGESMSQIALKYSTTAGMIRKQNRMKNNKLRAGKEITIPIPRQPIGSYTLTASARLDKLQNRKRSGVRHQHTVVKGETLWDIARKYGVSTKQLARWNGMAPGDMLRVGKPLVIWSRERPLPELKRRPAFATKMATQTIYYTVRANDTLSQIAEKFHTTTKALMRQNKLKRGAVIKVGQSLAIRLDATQATQ
ncbi:MAG: LysM peptidoglycan-binding domain-containing protein, partial [Gammaproteobacteria bacterium]|nr:LysM peptidoglycan-binding domain-containing protein [Gammaproteobacteria bacterium]